MTTKFIYILFAIAIIAGLIFTIQGFLASAPLLDTSERQLSEINADAARWTGQANRYLYNKPLDTERLLHINAAQTDRLNAAAEYYSAQKFRINAAQAARYNEMVKYYAEKQLRINQAQAERWTAAAKHYSESLLAQQEREKRIRDAEAARWTGLAAHYFAENP